MPDNPLDRYLPEPLRQQIEDAYYARINQQARLEQLVNDPYFWQDLAEHPAFFADHGVIHVRDVAQQVLQVLRKIHGVLIPPREAQRISDFMPGLGIMLAYLHDIGMVDVSEFGRAMHPEFAAHAVFSPALEEVVDGMWAANPGGVPDRLVHLVESEAIHGEPRLLFRELLALSIGHSKSKVPVQVLNDPAALRQQMLGVLSHDLEYLYLHQQLSRGKPHADLNLANKRPAFLSRYYSDFESHAFAWMLSDHPAAVELTRDAVDTLRALRCADALRQRGAVQKTSGGYQVFLSRQTGNPTFALRLGNDRMFLLELSLALSAGESNIASSEFTAAGDLRISFHRGAFSSDEALTRSISYTALTINDFLVDIIESFQRTSTDQKLCAKTSETIQVLLESTDDNPRFVELVQDRLRQLNITHAPQIHIVPSLQQSSDLERERYLEAPDLDWDDNQKRLALQRIERSGQKTTNLDLQEAFQHVKVIHLQAGEILVQSDTPSAFVYFPLGEGLRGQPLGGYDAFTVAAWMPLGNTGVIRGAARNANVLADRDLYLLVVPKDVYLRHWYNPYTPEELKQLLAGG